MATAPQAAPGNNSDGKAAATATTDSLADNSNNAHTATEKESDDFLNRETAGQVFDETSGQQLADQMDDSRRAELQAPTGPAPASAENLPDELIRPSEAGYTLPEMQTQGKTLTAEGDAE